MSAKRTIKKFRSIKKLLIALRDAIKAHRFLFVNVKIFHQDISENNIIITNPETADGFSGMLIDFDLAIVNGKRTNEQHMTDTMKFMTIDVFCGVEHIYKHDLESFFYVLLWICVRRARKMKFHCKCKNRPTNNVLRNWYENTNKKIAEMKQNFMHADEFDDILMKFAPSFDCIKSLCENLRNIFFFLLKLEGWIFEFQLIQKFCTNLSSKSSRMQ